MGVNFFRSQRRKGQACHATTAKQLRRRCGGGTQVVILYAMHVDCITNYTR